MSLKISVCMATFNGENYIKQQIDSILIQLNENDEIIISDDSSTDRTVEIIKSFSDKRITLFENNAFKSPIYNIENALKKATGDYLFLSDQDDVWLPNKVSVLKKYLQHYDLVISDAFVVNKDLNTLYDSFYILNGSKKGIINNLLKNAYLGCCIAFNRNILSFALPFPNDIPMHDWWLGLIAEMYGKPFFCQDKLIFYRRHGKNISPTADKSPYSFFTKVKFRMLMVKNLFLRLIKQ